MPLSHMNPIQGTHFEGQQKCLFVMGFVWTNIPTKVSTLLCWSVVTTSAAPSLTWCNNNNKKDMLDQIVVEVCNDEDAGDNDKWHDFGLPFPVELISCLNGTCKIKQAPAVASKKDTNRIRFKRCFEKHQHEILDDKRILTSEKA